MPFLFSKPGNRKDPLRALFREAFSSGTTRTAPGRAGRTTACSSTGRLPARARRRTHRAARARRPGSGPELRTRPRWPRASAANAWPRSGSRRSVCAKPPMPSAATTRWQGITIGSLLSPQAWPTARGTSKPVAAQLARQLAVGERAAARNRAHRVPDAALEFACPRSAAAGRTSRRDRRGSARAGAPRAPRARSPVPSSPSLSGR